MILSEAQGRLCNPADTKIEIVDYWNYTLFMQGNEIMQVRWVKIAKATCNPPGLEL